VHFVGNLVETWSCFSLLLPQLKLTAKINRSKFLLFLQQVLKLHRMHVVEQDVYSCFICTVGVVRFLHCSLEAVTFFDLVLVFQRFTPVSIACRW